MQTIPLTLIVLPGAGGNTPDLVMFGDGEGRARRFISVPYPGWRRYITAGYTADTLVDDIVARILQHAPEGPLHIVGLSIGGHFGYAAALRLQQMGREIGGFCAVDTYMMSSGAPSPGWRQRALALASKLMLGLRFKELGEFIRSRFWRAWLRASMRFLPGLLRRYAGTSTTPWIFTVDPGLEQELNMRLLIENAAPFVVALDRDPQKLDVPAVLLRTEFTGKDDAAWTQRCPRVKITGLPGDHQTLFLPESLKIVRDAFVSATQDWR